MEMRNIEFTLLSDPKDFSCTTTVARIKFKNSCDNKSKEYILTEMNAEATYSLLRDIIFGAINTQKEEDEKSKRM